MTKTLREHLLIHKKLSKAILYEAGIMVLSLCLKSVANKFFFALFMLALFSFVFTFIAAILYKNYLQNKFGKAARRVFFSLEKQDMLDRYKNRYNSVDSSVNVTTDISHRHLPSNIYHSDRFST